jgi:hypothetical protein
MEFVTPREKPFITPTVDSMMYFKIILPLWRLQLPWIPFLLPSNLINWGSNSTKVELLLKDVEPT